MEDNSLSIARTFATRFAAVCFAFLGLIFLIGTVWSPYVYPVTGLSLGNLYDLKRFLVLFAIGAAVVGAALIPSFHLIRLNRQVWWVLGVFFIGGSLSAMQSSQPYWGAVELANFGVLFAGFWLMASCVAVLERQTLFVGLYIVVLVFSLFAFAQFALNLTFFLLDTKPFDIHALISGFSNVRFFNQVQVMLWPLLLLPYFLPQLCGFQRISVWLAGFHWLVLFQSEARGAILALLVAALMAMLAGPADVKKTLKTILWRSVLTGLLLWLVFIQLLPWLLTDELGLNIRTSSSGRLDTWLYILKELPERWWLGYGPMSFVWAEGKPIPNAHAHNALMQILYEYGILVSLVVIVAALYWLKALWDTRDVDDANWVVRMSLLAGLGYSLISGVVVMPMAQLLLVSVVAVCSGRLVWEKWAENSKFILVILTLANVVCLYHSYSPAGFDITQYPRIWLG